MVVDALRSATRGRRASASTIRAEEGAGSTDHANGTLPASVPANLYIHNDTFSTEQVLFAANCFDGSGISNGDLVEIAQVVEATDVHDFAKSANEKPRLAGSKSAVKQSASNYLCLVKASAPALASKLNVQAVSVNKHVASVFGLTSPSKVTIIKVNKHDWTSSHVEICFRDAYLSRSDMWRFTTQELIGKTIICGQKLSFLNSLKATVRSIHLNGRNSRVAYFDTTTVPVFRSEAARYVIFIQMSREMWDFDSEGDGEILFNRVVNGFLPDLFKRWSVMEVRHLVSIVMFGRLEYKQSDILEGQGVLTSGFPAVTPFSASNRTVQHQDFYRVVVTDMASAQWTTILEELKKDFRVFLRDVCLFKTPESTAEPDTSEPSRERPPRITGRLSAALKGNVLEAINLAASQFSNDYVDRDLIRTGISTVVITAGSGVFDVERDLLRLTSETLTNNGIGIDIVCLSKMPLHSVPLFRYRLQDGNDIKGIDGINSSISPASVHAPFTSHPSIPDLSSSPAFSSTNASSSYFTRFPAAFSARLPQLYGFGIPQWIDLSYWSPESSLSQSPSFRRRVRRRSRDSMASDLFVPRVRMYELQMMGLMELGMADISVPFLNERKTDEFSSLVHWNSPLSNSQYSRSLSRSPELKRKSPGLRAQDALSSQRNTRHIQRRTEKMMDDYDRSIFSVPQVKSRPKAEKQIHQQKLGKHQVHHDPEKASAKLTLSKTETISSKTTLNVDSKSEMASIRSAATGPTRRLKAPRNFSYGLKGLMPFKATASKAEVQIQTVNAHPLAAPASEDSSDESRSKLSSRAGTVSRPARSDKASEGEGQSRPGTGDRSDDGSKPIQIFAATTSSGIDSITKQLWQQRRHQRNQSEPSKQEHTDDTSTDSDHEGSIASNTSFVTPSSVPDSKIPFVRNVNASNPLKRKHKYQAFGRWQHLYPHKPKSATVKWRSLCSPASVPLTTEGFPSKEDLATNYDALCHVVRAQNTDNLAEEPYADMQFLFLEMVSLRIAHGYQFVVGSGVADAVDEELTDFQTICRPDAARNSHFVVVLAMANTIQKLELQKSESVRITKYVQKPTEESANLHSTIRYDPYLRTILSNDYFPRRFVLRGFSEQYPWDLADNHLAGENDQLENVVRELRYWRARFVLLPVEPPASTWKKHQQEENEEEIHLLGIRALTQLWQRNRYVSVHDRRIMEKRMGSSKRRDENPLEVKMETLNPSELVALELDRLAQIEADGEYESTQLLPEPQKFDRETSMAKIAQAMQSDSGIEIKNRRWHLRLYYNCFHGEEFTNWLMHNVKNMNTRNEAVEFGNQLMKEGLFEHVNGRHEFKDGHYFYSIKHQHRQVRPDLNRSWFSLSRQSDRSVPPTPASEQPAKELSPLSMRTRSGSNLAQQIQSTSSNETKQKRKSVALSRMIRVNVDPKKKSFFGRSEVVNVHYDRFHNPENCYHMSVEWFTATSKLVDDAIVSWTHTAEKYGLKLIEAPISEACDIPNDEPFRSPYRIKLALDPPKQRTSNVLFNPVLYSATSFSPHAPPNAASADKHFYQKAILRRSNFVLDQEAAHEFPEGVDIHYNGARLNYKHTQFIHRSGVLLAQIMDGGDIILLANRLFNSRFATTKDATSRMFDSKRDSGPQSHRPAIPPSTTASMQASGIVGINLASPNMATMSSPGLHPVSNLGAFTGPSPGLNASNGNLGLSDNKSSESGSAAIADTFGPQSTFTATGLWNTLITPEQIKDDLEAFCLDKARLEAFFKEVANTTAPLHSAIGSGSRKATGSSSSSLLRPLKEVPRTMASDITGIPAFELPEAVTAVRELRRATVAYDNVHEMFDRNKLGSRHGSTGSAGQEDGNLAGGSRTAQGETNTRSPLAKTMK